MRWRVGTSIVIVAPRRAGRRIEISFGETQLPGRRHNPRWRGIRENTPQKGRALGTARDGECCKEDIEALEFLERSFDI